MRAHLVAVLPPQTETGVPPLQVRQLYAVREDGTIGGSPCRCPSPPPNRLRTARELPWCAAGGRGGALQRGPCAAMDLIFPAQQVVVGREHLVHAVDCVAGKKLGRISI